MTAAEKASTTVGFEPSLLSDALVEHAESAIIGVELNGLIVYWNQGAVSMYGYLSHEVIGTEYVRRMPDERRGEFRKVIDKVRRGRRLPAFDTVRRHKDGKLVDIHLAVHPVTDGQDNIVGICTVAMDISRLKNTERDLQASKSQVEAVVQTVLDGIVTINEFGIINSVNPATEKIFGYHAHEMIGSNVKMLMPEPYQSEHDGYLHNYMTTGEAKIIGIGREVQGRRRDGSTFPVDLAVTEMSVAGHRAFVGILRDITERKEAEEALHKLNRQYEDKLNELAATLAQLQTAQDQLVQSEKLASLGQMVAGVAHEINTPVGVCVTATSILNSRSEEMMQTLKSSGTLSADELQSYAAGAAEATAMIMRNLNRAAQLISSFKQVAVDRTSSELRKFNLRTFLDDVLASLSPVLKRKGHRVEVSCEDDVIVQNYPGALSQIVTNLVMNSVTHAFKETESGHIRIVAKVSEDMVDMEFTDDGCGIPKESLNKIFDPFFTTARGHGGTGLGLHVVHNLAHEVLGGDVCVDSRFGQGTSFHLRMPRIKDPEVAAMSGY